MDKKRKEELLRGYRNIQESIEILKALGTDTNQLEKDVYDFYQDQLGPEFDEE